MIGIPIIKIISMIGAIPFQFQLQSYFSFMISISIIKAISMKGAILIQFQLSHHLKLTLKLFTTACHGILIECYSAISI